MPNSNELRIKKYDKSGMFGLIKSFPEQCLRAKNIGYRFNPPDSYKLKYANIICAGMGGSAIGADILRSYLLDEAECPIFVSRSYGLPRFVGQESLVITSSYSGNTEETLSAYKDARRRGAKIIALTSGGRLEKYARADGYPVVLIPDRLPPRVALGYSLIPLIVILSKIGAINDKATEVDEAVGVLSRIKADDEARRIASRLYGKFPVIYASYEHTDAVATRWRGQIAENSKTVSSINLFPEMNHNEIVGWENPKKLLKDFAVVMLRDIKGDDKRILKRMNVTKKILKTAKIQVIEVKSFGDGLLARMLSLVHIGDLASFYLALLNKVDPTPVDRITYLKKELAKI